MSYAMKTLPLKPGLTGGVRVQRMVRRLELRVIAAARRSAHMITKANGGDESNIEDENVLVEAVEALNKVQRKTPNESSSPAEAKA